MFDSSTYTSRGRFKRTKFTPSTVDETLFGERRTTIEPDSIPKFEPPWIDNGKTNLKSPPKPLLFYCPNSPSRPSSVTRDTTPQKKYRATKFSATTIDHTLFDSKAKHGHDFKEDNFFTSMPRNNASVDDRTSIGVSDEEKEDSLRFVNSCSRPNTRKSNRRDEYTLKKPLPPWR